jgi:hypothetical protein
MGYIGGLLQRFLENIWSRAASDETQAAGFSHIGGKSWSRGT